MNEGLNNFHGDAPPVMNRGPGCERKKGSMTKKAKNVSILCFLDEHCQIYNALVTALSLLREGSRVSLFFGSCGVNAVHKEKVKHLRCLPDHPKEIGKR